MKKNVSASTICILLFWLCVCGIASAQNTVKVQSEPINETIWHFEIDSKKYISIGDSKKSIQIGYLKWQIIKTGTGVGYKVLTHKGMGPNDPWIGRHGDSEYKIINNKTIKTADLAYHTVKLNNTGHRFLMTRPLGSKNWQVALTDWKIYHEENGVLVHAGYESWRKVYFQDSELYLKMRRGLSQKDPWQAEYDGMILISPVRDPQKADKKIKQTIKKPDNKKQKGIPGNVISNGDGNQIKLSDFVFDHGKINVNFENKKNDPFTLVVLLRSDPEALAVYTDMATTHTIHTSGKVLFGTNMLKRTGTDKKGTYSISVQRKVYGVYDMDFTKGTVSVFALRGKEADVFGNALNSQSDFNACSNVLIKFLAQTNQLNSISAAAQSAAQTAKQAQKTVKSVQDTVKQVQKNLNRVNTPPSVSPQKTPDTKPPLKENKNSDQKTAEVDAKPCKLAKLLLYERGEKPIEKSKRRYTDSFFQSSTRYVFTEATFNNFHQINDHTHHIERVWYNPDGSIRGRSTHTLNVKPKWRDYWNISGWGWDSPGNWPPGKYRVEIMWDGVKIEEKEFNIIKKGFELTHIDFFEQGAGKTPDVSDRKYNRKFSKKDTRYINTEVNFKNLLHGKEDQTYKITRIWYDTNDRIERVKDYDLVIKSDWKTSYNTGNGWGWEKPGKWEIGAYRVEIYINNNFIDEGWFRIVE